MRLRFRALAALLALFALSLSWVPGVWASTCEPGMAGMGVESMLVAPADVSSTELDCPTNTGMSHSGGTETGQDKADTPACPFGPMAASGACAVAPLLPARAPVSLAPSPEGALLVVSPDPMRDLLSVFAFFRPPRA